MIELGRLSWRLRDDDNMLLGRLESQLLRAVQVAAERLTRRGLLAERERFDDRISVALADALLDPPEHLIRLPEESEADTRLLKAREGKPRQLVGQPAGPGIATGTACVINRTEDLLRIRRGQVLVCEAIQPSMTHIVPLVSAIVERRGGMLIHGAIIARELKIPCVNGVAEAVRLIEDGELVTVDGYLGIVTVGPPEFQLEAVDQRVSEHG
jgi:pyruvate,water dikinase